MVYEVKNLTELYINKRVEVNDNQVKFNCGYASIVSDSTIIEG